MLIAAFHDAHALSLIGSADQECTVVQMLPWTRFGIGFLGTKGIVQHRSKFKISMDAFTIHEHPC